MNRSLVRMLPAALVVFTGAHGIGSQQVWQADIQIRTLEITRNKGTINARVVVYTENDDEAQNARLLILLPIGVGLERLAPTCTAPPGPPIAPALRAAVTCEPGAVPDRGLRGVGLSTAAPTTAPPKRFGVFAYSSTPDPVPGNNYAERTLP